MASKVSMRCYRVRETGGAYVAPEGHAMPARAWHVLLRNVEEASGPQWGIAEIQLTVFHACHYVVGQTYDFEV